MFDDSYEVCNCKRVTIKDLKDAIILKQADTLRKIQDITMAGTECRHCIFPEGDLGKLKKKVYCIDILKEVRESGFLNG